MKSVIVWTLRQRRNYIIWWCVGIIAFIVLILAFYPPFRDQATQFDKQITEQIPAGAKAFISDTPDFLSPIGYLSSQIYFLMLPMVLSILAIGLGSSLIAREEKEGTIELLLSRPISRTALLFGKATAGMLIVFMAGFVSWASCTLLVHPVKLPVGGLQIAIATLACSLLALSFGALAFMITMLGKARVASIGLAALIALGGYIISSLSEVATWLKWPGKFMPFHYYHPADIFRGTYHWRDMLVHLSIISVCLVISVIAFRRRDISG